MRGCATLVRVPGLDAGDEDGFRRAMGGLGALGRNLLLSGGLRDSEPFRFCLTGGFTATVPYLIGLAEACLPSCGAPRWTPSSCTRELDGYAYLTRPGLGRSYELSTDDQGGRSAMRVLDDWLADRRGPAGPPDGEAATKGFCPAVIERA